MMPGRTSEFTSCQFTCPAFCSMTQNPQSPSGVLISVFFNERKMSMSQDNSEDFDLMAALVSMETKSTTFAMSK